VQFHSVFTCKTQSGKTHWHRFSGGDLFSLLFRFTVFVSSATSSKRKEKCFLLFLNFVRVFKITRERKKLNIFLFLLHNYFSGKFITRRHEVEFSRCFNKLTGLNCYFRQHPTVEISSSLSH
jgi:hypothetical protein